MIKKFVILGSIASGKSTLAKKIGKICNIPVVHLDKVLLDKNWNYRPVDEQIRCVKEIINQDSWIADGIYSLTLNLRAEKADVIVFLDTKPIVCLFRYFVRYLKNRGKARDDVFFDCKETWKKGIARMFFLYPKKSRQYERIVLENTSQDKVIHLKNKLQIKRFLIWVEKTNNG